jgi:hemerythrin
MALIEWRDEFNTGDRSVDHEHRELVDLINELHGKLGESAASRDDIEEFLGEINTKISAHFALEERLMRQAQYAEFEAHKDNHEELLDDIRDIMINYDEGAYADFEETLADNLNRWFTEHFSTFDAKLHKALPHVHHDG